VDIGEDAPATLSGMDLKAYIGELEKKMRDAAADLEFEEAARLRDEIKRLGWPSVTASLSMSSPTRPSPCRETRWSRGWWSPKGPTRRTTGSPSGPGAVTSWSPPTCRSPDAASGPAPTSSRPTGGL
jgi:hypothetical protein